MIGILLWLSCAETEPLVSSEAPYKSGPVESQGGKPNPSGGKPVSPLGVGVFKAAAPTKIKSGSSKAICEGCDVIVISVCSLRKDYVSAYGGKALTPSIDEIGMEGYRFERAYAASNFTLAGLTAVLTGRFASTTGVTGWDKGLTEDVPTLPEVLGIYGYKTAAFTIDSASGFRPDYGLDRGFQQMSIYSAPSGTPDGRHKNDPKILGATAKPMADWILNQGTEKPIFAMLHTRSAHFPFVVDDSSVESDPTGVTALLWDAGRPSGAMNEQAMPGMSGGAEQQGVVTIRGRDPLQVKVEEAGDSAVRVWKKRYREAVQRMDFDVRTILDALEERGRLEKSIIILVADHGESLNDHGELLHGDAYFDGVINVPLLIRMPGLDGDMNGSKALVSQVDILPTILESIGAVVPAGIDGKSLLPILTGEKESVRSMSLSEGGVARHDEDNLPGAVIAPPWILVKQNRGCGSGPHTRAVDRGIPVCLYRMDEDPGQKMNLAKKHPRIVEGLLTSWTDFRASKEKDKGVLLDLSPAFVEELQRTGYDFTKGVP
jgi:arylsulfatase A-like enzyme